MNQKKQLHNARAQRGFSLIEIAIVLGIVGLVIAGVWTAAATVTENRRLSTASQQLLQIAQNVRTLYSGQTTITTGDLTASMRTAGVFPLEMVDGSVVRNSWNGGVTIDGVAGPAFDVRYQSISQKACTSLAVGQASIANKIGLTNVIMNNNDEPADALTPITAASRCNAAGNTNNIVFRFNLRG